MVANNPECPRCGSDMEVDDGMARCPNRECLHAELCDDLDSEEE